MPYLNQANRGKIILPSAAYELNVKTTARLQEYDTGFNKGYRSVSSLANPQNNRMITYTPQLESQTIVSLNRDKVSSLFEISIGLGKLRRVIGIGFCITATIALTTNLILPSSILANKYQIYFLNSDSKENFNFDSEAFFYTDTDLNFTLVAIQSDRKYERKIHLPLVKVINISINDRIIAYKQHIQQNRIEIIEDSCFYYSSNYENHNGLPLFDLK